jgi:Tfp pilus assembly protein PilZ
MESERRSERYPSDRPLAIRCGSWTEFVETYASDICRGGMFVRCEAMPEVLSEIELRLCLPEAVEVTIHARVVHVVPVEQAAQHNSVAGIGVEFIHVDAEQKRQVLQLVEFARAQHEGTADPNASFAQTLFESSSMPARDVAARLSNMPDAAGDAQRARKLSQTAMQAVQLNDGPPLDRSDPSQVAVRARPNTAPVDRHRIMRTPTQPLHDATGKSGVHAPVARAATQPIVRSPTAPLHGASPTGRSSASTPIVRPATQPIVRSPTAPLHGASPTGRSSASTPIVRSPTGPLTAAGSRPNTAPIARTPTGPLGPSSATPQRAPSSPLSGTPGAPSSLPEAGAANASAPPTTPSGQPLPPPKPTDLNRLKIVLNSLAHKHWEDAAREAREMLIDNPGDPQVLKWQAVCFARISLSRNDPAGALEYYEKVLRYDENNREARDFVKTFQREKKLNAIPFGRYFTTKKK